MIHRLAVFLLAISIGFLLSCNDSTTHSNSKFERVLAAISGDTRTETTLFFTQNILLLRHLHSSNADMRWQLKNIWTGKQSSPSQLRETLETAERALEKLDLETRRCGLSAQTSPFREAVVSLDRAWKEQHINAQLSLSISNDLQKVRRQLLKLLEQSKSFTALIIDQTAKLTELRANKESLSVSYFITYILAKSFELEQRLQSILSNNVMDEDQIKKIMQSRSNISRILRGMFRGDNRANIKVVLNTSRRKIITSLQKQFKKQNYLALATAYEDLLNQEFTESNTKIDFDTTQTLIDKAINIANTLVEEEHECGVLTKV